MARRGFIPESVFTPGRTPPPEHLPMIFRIPRRRCFPDWPILAVLHPAGSGPIICLKPIGASPWDTKSTLRLCALTGARCARTGADSTCRCSRGTPAPLVPSSCRSLAAEYLAHVERLAKEPVSAKRRLGPRSSKWSMVRLGEMTRCLIAHLNQSLVTQFRVVVHRFS